ncbi:MAG: HlyC/CorC family transporter [Anaerolineales bacterium]|nr:HlyC/CorC family transporter [Anaerolineales bacterium]
MDLVVTATRASLITVRQTRLVSLEDELGAKAARTLELLKHRQNLRDALQLTLALLRFLLAGIVLDFLIPTSQGSASAINLGGLVAVGFAIWLAEFFVERHVLKDPERWALRLSGVARVVNTLMYPILFVLTRLSAQEPNAAQMETITEDELKSFVDASEQQGVLEQDEHEMIMSIVELGDTLVREVMVPRIDVFALDVDTPLEEARNAIVESGYSRIPVYEDTVDNILGLLYIKDILKVWGASPPAPSLRQLLRQPYMVPESKKLNELLAEMQGTRIHMAIVVDEYGGVAGLVTLEDIVEEIVGEIQDETDLGEEQPFQKISEDEYLFPGRISLAEFNEIMDADLSTENADTLGGFLFSELGRLPRAGEQVKQDGILFTVELINSRRIRRVRAVRTTRAVAEEEQDAQA